MNRRESFAALAGLCVLPKVVICQLPHPGESWGDWHEAATDMARWERDAIREHERCRRLGLAWMGDYQAPGVIRWHRDVSLIFATSNHGGDVSDLLDAAVDHFRSVGVRVLGHALTDCRSVGCCFVWRPKRETERILWEWVS